jgi:hypothetical protein
VVPSLQVLGGATSSAANIPGETVKKVSGLLGSAVTHAEQAMAALRNLTQRHLEAFEVEMEKQLYDLGTDHLTLAESLEELQSTKKFAARSLVVLGELWTWIDTTHHAVPYVATFIQRARDTLRDSKRKSICATGEDNHARPSKRARTAPSPVSKPSPQTAAQQAPAGISGLSPSDKVEAVEGHSDRDVILPKQIELGTAAVASIMGSNLMQRNTSPDKMIDFDGINVGAPAPEPDAVILTPPTEEQAVVEAVVEAGGTTLKEECFYFSRTMINNIAHTYLARCARTSGHPPHSLYITYFPIDLFEQCLGCFATW